MSTVRTIAITGVLAFFAIVPLSIVVYGALAGAIGGLALIVVLAVFQYPLLRYLTRNLKDEDADKCRTEATAAFGGINSRSMD